MEARWVFDLQFAWPAGTSWSTRSSARPPGGHDIKGSELGHSDVGDDAKGPQAGRNIGYADFLMHKYWHYKDIGFSPDNTPVRPADPANAVTIKLLTAGLAPSVAGWPTASLAAHGGVVRNIYSSDDGTQPT